MGRRVCVDYSCLDSSLIPCMTSGACLPVDVACEGACPMGMSVCPTTGLCHVTSLSESCDGSNVTCLQGQGLVQREDDSRYCALLHTLPDVARRCGSQDVYCESLGVCMNRSAPYLCQACPGGMVPCPDTGECVADLTQCCSPDEEFCEVLNTCLLVGSRCELPNIAPEVSMRLILLETLLTFDPDVIDTGEGQEVATFLGGSGTDFQGEELSVALTGASDVLRTQGEWQFLVRTSPDWQRIEPGMLSDTSALLLPSTARLRFARRSPELDGAVWLRARLWDGNQDGYLSPNQMLVRHAEPRLASTLPFSETGAFSRDSLLLTVLLHPLVSRPTFAPSAVLSQQFTAIEEDISFSQNLGNSLSELVVGVEVTDYQVLPEGRILGFPDSLPPYENLLPAEVRGQYYAEVARVNPTRVERSQARQAGQGAGVAVMLDPTTSGNLTGSWQVALRDDPKLFLDLQPLFLSTGSDDVILLNTSARLRYLPGPDFCGEVSVLLAPWDGFWSPLVGTRLERGHMLTSAPAPDESRNTSSLSLYNLNAWQGAGLRVECLPDAPQVLEGSVRLSSIPYRLVYRYEQLFTVEVERGVESLRREETLLANYLQLVLQHPVSIERFSAASGRR